MSSPWQRNYSRYKTYFLNNIAEYRKRKDVKVYLELLLSLATIVVFSVFALRPTLISIAELIKEIETQEETIETMDKKIANLEKAQTLYNSQKERLSLIDQAIPKKAPPDVFIRQIEGISLENNVNVTSFSIKDVTIRGQLKERPPTAEDSKDTFEIPQNAVAIPFSLGSASNYTTMEEFITSLETLRMPVVISSINLNSSNISNVQGVSTNINGQFVYLKTSQENQDSSQQ
jgi:hypothetical protein